MASESEPLGAPGAAALMLEARECVSGLGEFLGSLVDGRSASFGEASFGDFFSSYKSIVARMDDEALSVAILALTKSGKSTFLNALVGANLLPCNNVPETARICAIRHAPALSPATATLSYRRGEAAVSVAGADAIRAHLRELNHSARALGCGAGGAGGGSLGGGGGAREEGLLSIQVPIAALAAAEGFEGPNVCLLDTPGPNEYGQDGLKYAVERQLECVDAVVYLLDYTKLRTAEEGALLGRLRECNPALVRRLCRRLFFVVNKVDVMEGAEGLGAEETRCYVAELITQQIGGAAGGFSLHPDQVFLLSARDALLARLVLLGRAEEEDRAAFMRKAFGKRWARVKDEEEIHEEAEEMLKESGIVELEAGVLGFLASRSAVIRLVAVLDDAERLLAQISNLAQTAAGTLRGDVETLQAHVAGMQARLAATLAQFDSVQQEVQELEGHVVDEVRARLDSLRRKLEGDIDAALDPAGACRAAGRGRWPAVWSKAKRLLGFGGGRAADVSSAEEMQVRLAELHSDIFLQIEAEVKEWWHSLEVATNCKIKQLFATINAQVAQLSQKIEAEVSCRLALALHPADMRIRPPTAEQFHASLQDLFAHGIRAQSRTETQVRREQRTVFVREERQGLCNSFDYWVPRTEEAVVSEEVQVTTYAPDRDRIKEYFVALVAKTTENSARHVKAYVHKYLAAQLSAARLRLQAYANHFSLAMSDALVVAQQGEEERGAALARVEAHCRTADELLGRVHTLQGAAEALLGPSWEAEEEAALELELGLEGEEALQHLAASGFSLWAPPLGIPPAADAPDTYPAAATAGAAGSGALPDTLEALAALTASSTSRSETPSAPLLAPSLADSWAAASGASGASTPLSGSALAAAAEAYAAASLAPTPASAEVGGELTIERPEPELGAEAEAGNDAPDSPLAEVPLVEERDEEEAGRQQPHAHATKPGAARRSSGSEEWTVVEEGGEGEGEEGKGRSLAGAEAEAA